VARGAWQFVGTKLFEDLQGRISTDVREATETPLWDELEWFFRGFARFHAPFEGEENG
jgi:hypothetical protein